MIDAKLDALLAFAREPEPQDDAFLASTMSRIRDGRRRRDRRRTVTALASAAVIVIGAAVAGVVRLDDVSERNVTAEAARERTHRAGGNDATPVASPHAVSSDATSRSDETDTGYAGENTAYAVDRQTGLRLQTSVADTHVDAGAPQTVTVSLANTGDRAVTVEAPRRCALLVGAYLANDGSPEGDETSHPWQCTATTTASSVQQDERFVLEPGDAVVGEATIVLSAAGDWRLVGMCRCTFRPADAPAPKPSTNDPLEGVPPLFAVSSPLLPPQDRTTEQDTQDLVTPPIRVTAR